MPPDLMNPESQEKSVSFVSWVLLAKVAAIAFFGVVLTLGASALTPALRTLNHEFAEFHAVFQALMLFWLGAWTTRRLEGEPLERFHKGILTLSTVMLGSSALVHLGMVLVNSLGPDCRIEEGASFFWITTLPLGLVALVAGAGLGLRPPSYRLLLGIPVAVLLISLLHDAAQAIWGPRIVDLILGEPLGFDQRTDMALTSTHVRQRLLVLLFALFTYCAIVWRVEGAQRNTRRIGLFGAILTGVALLSFAAWAGPQAGFGWSWRPLRTHLDAGTQTENFLIKYSSNGPASSYVVGLMRDAEWEWADLTTRWSITPEKNIRIYLFDTAEDQRAFTGMSAPHAGLGYLSLTLGSLQGNTLRHELVHALNQDLDPSVRVILNRGLLEGLAQAYTGSYTVLPESHRKLAAALENGMLPRASKVFSFFGFFTLKEGNAYHAAASFVGYLILTHGFESFVVLERTLDFEKAYGRDIDTLDREWRAFLREIPVDANAATDAKDAFDPVASPGYSDKQCPKLGRRHSSRAREAAQRRKFDDYTGALVLYEKLLQKNAKPRWVASAVDCLDRLGRCEEGIHMATQALADPGLDRAERSRLFNSLLRCQVAEQDWEAIEDTLDALEGLEISGKGPDPSSESEDDVETGDADDPDSLGGGGASLDRQMLRAALSDPELRESVADAVHAEDPHLRRVLFERMLAAKPESEALRYLYLTRSSLFSMSKRSVELGQEQKQAIISALALLEQSPEAANRLAPKILDIADRAIRTGDHEFGARVGETLARTCTSKLRQYDANERLRRIAWERGEQGLEPGEP